jgi:hypothetical protein
MSRASPSDVEAIFDTDLSTSTVQEWLNFATLIVDDIEDKDPSINATRLKKIETLLASHMASSQDQRIQSASAESKSVEYAGSTDSMDIRGTKHGQNAIALDPTGTLSTLGKPKATLQVPEVKKL